ncbi:hypothetical protein [Leptospira interrogans]|uniref:hypothetical protein n=1 Tax=Leptospira interrogans TaxID=173 RepID=UPI0012FB8314|nr:hypothetical protein [Leptospira interrogans]
MNAKFLLLGLFLSLNCYTGPYRYYDDCSLQYSIDCGRNFDYRNRSGYYPYRNHSNYYKVINNGRYRHNPFYVPSGRFHNFGRSSKWKF